MMLGSGCACSLPCLLFVDGGRPPFIHVPSIHHPCIHSSIHPPTLSITKFIFSAIQREIETDKCTYTPRDGHSQNKDRHRQIQREIVTNRHREKEVETQTLMQKEMTERQRDRDEGETDTPRGRRALAQRSRVWVPLRSGRQHAGPGLK